MTLWGYFVAPSVQQSNNRTIEQSNILKVLWVGRMLHWKRVDTIIRAVREVESTKREAEELRMEIEQLKQLRTNYFIRCRALIKGQEELLSAMENDQRMQEELRRPAAPVAGNVLA